jgi:cell division protein ZapA (FtsZ GTPase activity inhibitor)
MGEQMITISIADRPYRLAINNEKEEENVRKAARLINEKVKEYSTHYAFKDKQDLLAMVVLQFAAKVMDLELQNEMESKKTIEGLIEIEKILS